ncbi:hypothetical protein GTJ91_21470 [Pseudomonas oryzihabitans]|nr:hypothetical protein [Pseudomonas oryzihabitans]
MMGQLPGGQQRLFYSFNLEDHVPPQHLLRSIDQCLDLSDLRAHLSLAPLCIEQPPGPGVCRLSKFGQGRLPWRCRGAAWTHVTGMPRPTTV